MELLYASVTVASNVPIEVWAKLVPSWICPLINELVTIVVDNLVELLLEQEAEVSIKWQ